MDLISSYRRPLAATVAVAAAFLSTNCTSTSTSATAPSAAKCQVAASAAPTQFGANGGNGTLNISASRDCGWTVAAQAAWVSVSGSQAGYGDAALSYTIASNPAAAARTAELVVDNQHLPLTQAAAACTYALSRSGDTVGAAGGTLSFQISTLVGCTWTASADATWLSLPGTRTGSSTASIAVTVAPNTGAARAGAVLVAGRSYTVSQDAAVGPAPTPAPSPAPSPTPSPSPAPSPAPAPSPIPISLSGTVSSLIGTCPSLRFTADKRTVTTDRETSYSRGRCGDLSNGDILTIGGTLQSDGVVLAGQIEFNRNEK